MPGRILTRGSAFLLLAVGLDDINSAVTLQRPIDKIVKPRLWQLPASIFIYPLRRTPSRVLQPFPIVVGIRKSGSQLLSFFATPQNYGSLFLVSNLAQFGVADVRAKHESLSSFRPTFLFPAINQRTTPVVAAPTDAYAQPSPNLSQRQNSSHFAWPSAESLRDRMSGHPHEVYRWYVQHASCQTDAPSRSLG